MSENNIYLKLVFQNSFLYFLVDQYEINFYILVPYILPVVHKYHDNIDTAYVQSIIHAKHPMDFLIMSYIQLPIKHVPNSHI